MPSPIAQCTSLADLQALVRRTLRLYPQLDWRILAAGGLVAADLVEPIEPYELFRVNDATFGPSLVDLQSGTCSCQDYQAPIIRETKLCEHVLACLVLGHLAERATHLLTFRPFRPQHGPGHATQSDVPASPCSERGWRDTIEFPPAAADAGPSEQLCPHLQYAVDALGIWCAACGTELPSDVGYRPIRPNEHECR
jgi:hypothetical protein